MSIAFDFFFYIYKMGLIRLHVCQESGQTLDQGCRSAMRTGSAFSMRLDIPKEFNTASMHYHLIDFSVLNFVPRFRRKKKRSSV